MKRAAAILLSRQPLRPGGRTAWVRESLQAMLRLQTDGFSVITSTGMQTWELLMALAAREGVMQKVVLPISDTEAVGQARLFAERQFDLRPELVEFVGVTPHGQPDGRVDLMHVRDMAAVSEADLLLPVSVRPGGSMSRLLEQAGSAGKPILREFQVEYAGRKARLGYRIKDDQLSREIAAIGEQYLTHWTRAPNSAWPTERLQDYFLAVAESGEYPRSAAATLQNIVLTGTIVASPRNMPDGTPTVSFSSLPPRELTPLIRWRARHSHMSFEPYGVGIDKDAALSASIRPVRYYSLGDRRSPPQGEHWLRQSAGERSDWRREKEYRFRGDFDLSRIARDKLLLFCRYRSEAAQIQKATGIKTVSFLADTTETATLHS